MTFVWKSPSGKNLVTGGSNGKLKIERDLKTGKRTVQGLVLESESQKDTRVTGTQPRHEKVLLDDFVTKVKGYVKH
jgi:hypothetical protein